ncbi:MAG: hypothetical protein GF384_03585 [Elusimicrobia bacterium]|nr:hypothetical protein [Elusimicrobiota bacterium]MBD3411996.1 hypothetical protein [Elusimicrobiota bacterium]
MMYTVFIQRPLVVITLAFGAGIVTGACCCVGFTLPLVLFSVLMLGTWCVRVRTNFIFTVMLSMSAFVLGILSVSFPYHCVPESSSVRKIPNRSIVWVHGIICAPVRYSSSVQSACVITRTLYYNNQSFNLCMRVWLKKWGYADILMAGDHITAQGRWSLNERSSSYRYRSGMFGYTGAGGTLYARSDQTFMVNRDGLYASLMQWIIDHKTIIKHRLREHLSARTNAVLRSVMFGEHEILPQRIQSLFVKTGTMHFLAVSGLHTGIVLMVGIAVFRLVNLPFKAVYMLSIALMTVYALMTGLKLPVVRASIMGTIILAGYCIDREADLFNTLAIAGMMILLFRPYDCFSIGFQLSFNAVLWIGIYAPIIYRSIVRGKKGVLIKNICMLFSVSLAAWLGTMPLVAYYFNYLIPISIIANLIVFPLVFVMVAGGIGLIVTALIGLPGAGLVGNSLDACTGMLIHILALLSRIPFGSLNTGPMPGWWVIGYYATCFSWWHVLSKRVYEPS